MLQDGRDYHRALYHAGDALNPRGWHHDNTTRLLELLKPYLFEGAVGLDYATGTGGSAIPLLQHSDHQNLDLEIALTDVMPSWFLTAHQLLNQYPATHFFLLNLKSEEPLVTPFGGNKFDFIVSASTIHLLPEKKLGYIFQELFTLLKPGGVLVFNTGDIECQQRETQNAALLHDVYRITRDLLHQDGRYRAALEDLERRDPQQHARILKTHSVFPKPLDSSQLNAALQQAGFETVRREHQVIEKSKVDSLDFIQVARLTGIAGAISSIDARRALIREFMGEAHCKLMAQGEADSDRIRTYWTFGVEQKPTSTVN